MSKEAIVERILFDAKAEAEAIKAAADEKAAAIIEKATLKAQADRERAEAEMRVKAESILSKKAAAARLESAKLLLAEKRKVIDEIYALALKRMVAFSKEDALKLTEKLLNKYAEEGDVVFFAENYEYVENAKLLPVLAKKNLKISNERAKIGGGFLLRGVKADKDLSYESLLKADREDFQAELAADIFD